MYIGSYFVQLFLEQRAILGTLLVFLLIYVQVNKR